MYNAEHAMKTTYNDIGLSLEILQAESVVSHYPEVNGIELHDIFHSCFDLIDGQMTNGLDPK